MEINAEISTEDHAQVIRNYYLGKDWTKRIAILALIALGLALAGAISDRWNILYGVFDLYFFVLSLFFFALPYGIYYLRMRKAIKLMVCQPLQWAFNISETGVYTKNDEKVRFYPWAMVEKVTIAGEYMVFKPAVGQVFCVPVASLEHADPKVFLADINNYRRRQKGQPVTSITYQTRNSPP